MNYETAQNYVNSVESNYPSSRYSDSGRKYLTSGSDALDDVIDLGEATVVNPNRYKNDKKNYK